MYRLGYPNLEVQRSLSILEMSVLTDTDKVDIDDFIYQIRYALEHKDIETFLTTVRSLLARIPFNLHIARESYYHSLFQLLCNLMRIETQCELASSKGKIDLTITTSKYVYLCEFKFKKSGKDALKQIMRNRYYEPFLTSGKEIVLVGVAFDIRNKDLILDWEAVDYTPDLKK